MKYSIFAYKDTELGKFQPAFLAPATVADAVEGISDAAVKGKIDDLAHKELYYFGTFDSEIGFELAQKVELILDLKPFDRSTKANV